MGKDVVKQKRKLFHTLLSVEEVLSKLEQLIKPLGIETVDILNAYNRVIAEDIYAPMDYPPFDRSEVDGYAVSIKSVEGVDELHSVELKVIGKVSIGENPSLEVSEGVAVAIDTGAVIPRGADGVVMEEFIDKINDKVVVFRGIAPGENISYAGSDIARDEIILYKGSRLTHLEIGVLAALGIKHVKVYKKPRAVVLSIGNELKMPGDKLDVGRIYDSNGYAITTYLKSLGIEADYYGILPDDENIVYNAISTLLSKYDIVITSGGTSAGEEDVTYRVFEKIGNIIVHGIRVKPGKPTVIAVTENGKILFGLPGFPFSALSIAITILKFVIDKLEGHEYTKSSTIKALTTFKIRKDIGRKWYIPVVLSNVAGRKYAIMLASSSGSVSSLLKADGIAILEENRDYIDEGEEIEVIPVREREREAVIAGSHDMLLTALLSKHNLIERFALSFIGSYKGLDLVRRGYVDIAPVHLFDPVSGEYNVPFIKNDEILKKMAILVRGYRRRLVLAFRKGNPKNIKGFADIVREDIRFVNRNKGSGTRALIDKMIMNLSRQMGIEFSALVKRINGYWYEISTHTGVAAAIAQGRADVGVCSEYAAISYGLDYLPLTWEFYDFLINVNSLEKDAVKKFIDLLLKTESRELINSFKGYEAPNDMGSKLCC
ncbi:molybdopterin biosynthesis protein [Ignisphaera sp. 4213-co]|uniref:Molybdopterin biosynthesis protein n=1 Tax=Ignisphaera cupida TaxID=3050454 RepID=A0ABD4Z818_9CREN|nr:molybdopterin biosynthesis protein [Ignisphaera sp. 4213-co]MDK6029087.1 molybdopterin biosynthesis protein [Ignisphaera sp. 4213-co]